MVGSFKAATLLSIIVFLAFGFQVIGVFSEPVSHGYLPIAERDGYNYGVLGWCRSGKTGTCSKYGVGYHLQGDSKSRWSSSAQNILSSIMIVHIVAAGMLIIGLFFALATHARNRGLWIFVEIWLGLSFIASTLSFVVEIVLFGTNLRFAGWFALAGAILSLIAVIAMGVMIGNLSSKSSKPKDSTNSFMEETGGVFDHSGFFTNGTSREDEGLLKSGGKVSTTELSSKSNRGPTLKATSVHHGYQRVPEGSTTSINALQDQQKARLPVSPSTESVGALPRQANKPLPAKPGYGSNAQQPQNGQQAQYGQQALYGQGQYGQGQRAQQGQNPQAWNRQNANPNATRQPIAQTRQQQQHQHQQNQQQGYAVSAPVSRKQSDAVSLASTDAGIRVPAGAYVRGVEQTEKYGPNVVNIPKVRNGANGPAETFDFGTGNAAGKAANNATSAGASVDAPGAVGSAAAAGTGTVAAAGGAAAGGAAAGGAALAGGAAKTSTNPMLERYVNAEAKSSNGSIGDPFYDTPSKPASASSPPRSDGGSSHYSTANQGPQPAQAPTGVAAPAAAASTSTVDPSGYGAYDYQQYYQPMQPNYQPYSYADVGSYAYQPGYQTGYQGYQGYAPQAYAYNYQAPMYAPAAYQPPQTSPSRPAPPAQRSQKMQRSEFALNSNPDFSIAGMGNRKRGNNNRRI